MEMQSVADFNNKLQNLNTFFSHKQTEFCQTMSQHHGQLTSQDYQEFAELIDEIRSEASRRIGEFVQGKMQEKCSIYQAEMHEFSTEGEETTQSLRTFSDQLEENTIGLKQTQQKKDILLQHFSAKYSRNATLKRYFRILKGNAKERKRENQLNERMRGVYHRNLFKKAFFPWRKLTYQSGYASRVARDMQQDKMNLHEQYQSIVTILKDKVNQVEELIRLKKAAKGQFAYALSKNLLKTISNLSMEVMSLNQMSLKDGEVSEGDTRTFMSSVDTMIKDKLKEINNYKTSLMSISGEETKRKKKITFQ